jgi:hypothetical protein
MRATGAGWGGIGPEPWAWQALARLSRRPVRRAGRRP